MGFYYGERTGPNEFKPSTLTNWLIPKGKAKSGNTFNMVGQKERSLPEPHFHGTVSHPWAPVLVMFLLRAYAGSGSAFVSFVKHMWRDKFGHEDVAPTRVEKSPEEFTSEMKAFALAHPEVEVVGVTRMRDEWKYVNQNNMPHEWIIVIGRSMDYDKLAENLEGDFSSAITQVIGGYEQTQHAAVDIANWIRRQGWEAKGYGGLTNTPGEMHMMIPPAIEAGLGQLAKNGSVISDKLGSAFRLSTVLTNLPLVADQPREIGVDEFCKSCKKCTTDCPPGAISDEKKLVRGDVKWYVDFDKCLPFMSENKACAICLSTCPWSRPGIAKGLSEKMLRKMGRQQEAVA